MRIEIETNHGIGDVVFFLKNDKIKTGTVYKVEITFDDSGRRIYLFIRDANDNIAVVDEEKAFPSKEQLIQSL